MGKQGILDDAPSPVAVAAVVFAPCVEVLGVSPGNCTAVCGLTDADALIPAPAGADPIAAEPVAAGANFGDVDVFNEAAPDEPLSQPSAIERLPMNEPPEQGIPGRTTALLAGASNVVALVPDVVPF